MREKEAEKLQKLSQVSAPLKFRGYLLSWMKGCSKLDRERDWESKVFRPRTLHNDPIRGRNETSRSGA